MKQELIAALTKQNGFSRWNLDGCAIEDIADIASRIFNSRADGEPSGNDVVGWQRKSRYGSEDWMWCSKSVFDANIDSDGVMVRELIVKPTVKEPLSAAQPSPARVVAWRTRTQRSVIGGWIDGAPTQGDIDAATECRWHIELAYSAPPTVPDDVMEAIRRCVEVTRLFYGEGTAGTFQTDCVVDWLKSIKGPQA